MKKQIKLQLYESLEDLPLFNWSKMNEKNDVNWLRMDFDGRQSKIQDDRMILLKKRLEDEYFLLWDDDNFKETLDKRKDINYYIGLYENVNAILNRMWLGFSNDQMENRLIYIRQLKALKYVMPELNSVEGDRIELERLFQQNEGIKTKIKMLLDDIEVDGKKKTRRLNTELANISSILDLGYSINAKEISVADYIDFQKQAKIIIAKQKTKE